MNWILPLKQKYADRILDERKDMLVLKGLPRFLAKGDRVFVCPSGTMKIIPFSFKVRYRAMYYSVNAWIEFKDRLCMSEFEYDKYVSRRTYMYFIELEDLHLYNPPLHIDDFHINKLKKEFTLVTTEVSL